MICASRSRQNPKTPSTSTEWEKKRELVKDRDWVVPCHKKDYCIALCIPENLFYEKLSETGFSSDKRRFGGIISQKREDRQNMAMLAIGFLHTLFFIRVQK